MGGPWEEDEGLRQAALVQKGASRLRVKGLRIAGDFPGKETGKKKNID